MHRYLGSVSQEEGYLRSYLVIFLKTALFHFTVIDRECAAHHVDQKETAFSAFVTATIKQLSDFSSHLYFVGIFKKS